MKPLTLKDFEGIEIDPSWSKLDYLAMVAKHALEKLNKLEEQKKKDKGKEKLDSEQRDEQHWMKQKDDNKKDYNDLENLDGKHSRKKKLKKQSEKALRSGQKRKRELTRDHEFQEPKEENKDDMEELKIGHSLALPKELPREFMETLQRFAEGKSIEEPQLVIEKRVEQSDCSKSHNRLSIPESKLKLEQQFVTEDELAYLKSRRNNGKNVNGIDVNIIEPLLQKSTVSLRRWVMQKQSGKSSVTFNLTEHWNDVVTRNSLRPNQVVQVWLTRVDGKLWFLIVRIKKGGGNSTNTRDSQSPGNENDGARLFMLPRDPADEPGPSTSTLELEPDEEHHHGLDTIGNL